MKDVDKAAHEYLAQLLSGDNQEKINVALRRYQAKEKNTAEIYRKAVEAKIADKEKEYDTLLSNMTKAELPPEVMAALGEKLTTLKGEIAALREAEPPQDYTRDQIGTWLQSLKEAPDDKAIQLLIERTDITKKGFRMQSTLKSLLSVERLELVDGLEPPTC